MSAAFWADDFWAPDFWADDFWTGLTGVVPPHGGGDGPPDGSAGGHGGRGGGRVISSGKSYYPSRDKKLLDEIARVEAEIRRREAEEKALVAKQRYDTVDDLRRIASRLIDLELLLAKLRDMQREVEQREYLEALDAYEAYQRRKLH